MVENVERQRRIALYGGTFDPVHVGHLKIAEKLLELFELDQVLFIPAHVAPHKRKTVVSRALHRYAMLVLATQHEERFSVSTLEIDEPKRPYTVDTLTHFKTKLGPSAQLFFVMGTDSWEEITTWRSWEQVLTLTNHIVVSRPGYELNVSHIPSSISERIVDLRGLADEEELKSIDGDDEVKIYLTDVVQEDISSTSIRKGLREDINREAVMTSLVVPPVAEYIRKYNLYRNLHGPELINTETSLEERSQESRAEDATIH